MKPLHIAILIVALFPLFAFDAGVAQGKESSLEKAWKRDWKKVKRHDVLDLGGMNTKKAALMALPFSLGQTGIVARMDRKALRYVVTRVMPESPADGRVRAKDELTGVGGASFTVPKGYPAFVGPQVALGSAMLKSWGEHEGHIVLNVERGGKTLDVALELPGRGMFGKSFPQDDALADALISAGCELLVSRQLASGAWDKGQKKAQKSASVYTTSLAMLALMASGEKRWRGAIKRAAHWLRDRPPAKHFPTWHYAYLAITLGEYYLLTKDASVKPAFQASTDSLAYGQFDYYGSGHGEFTGNYRGRGISVCTTHALLGLAYAKRCGAKVPEGVLQQTMDHIERISPHGGVPYVIWGRTGKALKEAPPSEPNSKNEHAARSGTALLAFRLLGGNPAHQKRMSAFLARNSDYMDNGHATGNTLGWIWGSLGLASSDPEAFAKHMQRRAWWLALKWRHDGGTMAQPAECVNFRSSDHALGPHGDLACQVAVLAAPRRALLATGRTDSVTTSSSRSSRRLVSLARWDHHHGRLRRLDLIPALIKKKIPQLTSFRSALAQLDPDKPDAWAKGCERVAKRLPELCRKLMTAAKNEDHARACVLLATAMRPSIEVKRKPKGLVVRGLLEQIPSGEVSFRVSFEKGGEGRSSFKKLPAEMRGKAKGGPLSRAKHEAFKEVLALKGKTSKVIDVPVTCHIEWEGIKFSYPARIQHGTNPHKFGYTHRQPLIRLPLEIVEWANEGVLLKGGLRERLTVSCNQVGILDAGTWRLLKREERSKNFPARAKVWCSLYDLGFHRPFVHEVEMRK